MLSESTREKLQKIVLKSLIDSVSDMGCEEIAMDGFVGLNDYTDQDLVEHLEVLEPDPDDKRYALLQQATAEMSMHQVLTDS